MSHKRHFVLDFGTQQVDVYCDSLPLGTHTVGITVRSHKIAQRRSGPNYDGSPNSVQAALLYASVHKAVLWRVWNYLYLNRSQWVSGGVLIDLFGTAALERVRELRTKYGWPIEGRSHGVGVWDYRLNLQMQPQAVPTTPKRVVKRLPRKRVIPRVS